MRGKPSCVGTSKPSFRLDFAARYLKFGLGMTVVLIAAIVQWSPAQTQDTASSVLLPV